MTMVLYSMPTGSPLGVKLMMGFEAVADPRGLTLPGIPGLTPSPLEKMMLPEEPVQTGDKKLVQLGKYSFKTLDESGVIEPETGDKSEEGTEKESISKRPIGGYIALTVFALLVLLVAGNKFCSKKEAANEKQNMHNEPHTAK